MPQESTVQPLERPGDLSLGSVDEHLVTYKPPVFARSAWKSLGMRVVGPLLSFSEVKYLMKLL